jgi:hypothetical protein
VVVTSFENTLSIPEALTAVTTKKYCCPEVNPITTKEVPVPALITVV